MSNYKIGAEFDIVKHEGKRQYTLMLFNMLYSHPNVEDVFLFHEDLLDSFLDLDYWKGLPSERYYRIFIVLRISPIYTDSWEGGRDLDGWDWEILILTHEDLGEALNAETNQSR